MIEAVFISDLHLHPDDFEIQARFNAFLGWVSTNSVKRLYILGDFFHVWTGDDSLNEWSRGVARQLKELQKQGVQLFYLHGNRDFLLGKTFARLAGWQMIADPSIIDLGDDPVMLSHGDRFCTKDKAHQWFRMLTRNSIFSFFFLKLPLQYRQQLAHQVRQKSQDKRYLSLEEMDVVSETLIKNMQAKHLSYLIHGHTHRPGLTTYFEAGQKIQRYVLSDWDDTPHLLCYDNTKGLYFVHDFLGDTHND